jgi:uncharacterized radical SAM superfamily Fe-S cluster-containing enzyme
MTSVRLGAVEAIRQAELCCTLACAVTKNVNDDEMGAVISFALDNIDTVRAINFQASTGFPGRFPLEHERPGYSLRELLQLIEEQTGLPAGTFYSGPFSHAQCNAMSLVYLVDGKLEPLFKYISLDDVNAFLQEDKRDKLLGLFAGKKDFFKRFICSPSAWKMMAKAAPIFGHNPLEYLKAKHLIVFAKSFIQPANLDMKRMEQCCYGIAAEQGVFSFCAYNHLHRFPQAKPA